jgi:predicted NBD/HSP70 family sugar kinase
MVPVSGIAVGTLDIGGTHVTAALADVTPAGVDVREPTVRRHELRSDGTAEQILATLVGAGRGLALAADAWLGIAIPGPFDIVRGVGLFHSVGKFDALNGVDVRTPLARGLGLEPDRVVFVPDAQAFLRGEWVAGAAAGHDRAAGITLGTGVGSAFLASGEIVADGKLVPPEGRVDLIEIDGRPLEETVSRRAILAAYEKAAASPHGIDVQEIFERARAGQDAARSVIDTAITALGRALGPWLDGFGATVLVVGGAMSGSWDLIESPLRDGLVSVAPALDRRLTLCVAREREQSLLVGAAWQCARTAAEAPG